MVRAEARIATPARYGFTVLGAVTYDFNLNQEGGLRPAFFDYGWRGVASNESAELFRLQRTRIPLQNLSASLVFTFLFPERWWGRAGIGIGTSILFASGGGPFQALPPAGSGTALYVIVATVQDSLHAGAPLPGVTVTFSVLSPAGGATPPVVPTSTSTDKDGLARAYIDVASSAPVVVTAQVGGQIRFTAVPP